MLFAITTAKKLKMRQFDIKTAFLYGDLREDVFMKQPIGLCDVAGRVCKLLKGLCNLMQSSRCWDPKVRNSIGEFGFESSKADSCVFVRMDGKNMVILFIYVDYGMVFGGSDKVVNRIIDQLKQVFEVKVVNHGCFVGIEINRLKDGSIFIHQTAYARKVIQRFGMEICALMGALSDPTRKLSQNDGSEPSNFPYR